MATQLADDERPACSMCLEDYTADGEDRVPCPYACGHSNCSACVRDLFADPRPPQCPLCRAPSREQPQRNFDLINLIGERERQARNQLENPQHGTMIPADTLTVHAAIANGSAGTVVSKGVLCKGGSLTQVAVKWQTASAQDAAAFQLEQDLLWQASRDCSQTCRMLGVCRKDGVTYLVMRLYKCSLAQYISAAAGGKLSIEEACRIGYQITKALQELHAVDILHLGMEPANVLLDNHNDAFLADFGNAQKVADASGLHECSTSLSGNPHYMAPEAVGEAPVVSCHTDAWSLASMLLHMVTGLPPFHGLHSDELLNMLRSSDAPLPDTPSSLPASLRHLLRRCFQSDPHARPTLGDIQQVLQPALDEDMARQAAAFCAQLQADRLSQIEAAHTISSLAKQGAPERRLLVAAGCVPQLANVLNGGSHSVQCPVLEALLALCMSQA
ncbi:hypothetical protein WJX72_003784 [[Myrmecia] bisecta]|uniref:Protein kinase n=1 Tax=[Myrmecia] bisecta TaxID=41462 RepID=A0AAW1PST1_9CHLO